jgi:hypothetical protein
LGFQTPAVRWFAGKVSDSSIALFSSDRLIRISIDENGTAPDSISVTTQQNAAKFARLRVRGAP